MIDYDILLSRVQVSFGVSGAALNWIRITLLVGPKWLLLATLVHLSLRVFGVPQSSVLGPLFFT